MRFLVKTKSYKLLHLVTACNCTFSYPLKSNPSKWCQKSGRNSIVRRNSHDSFLTRFLKCQGFTFSWNWTNYSFRACLVPHSGFALLLDGFCGESKLFKQWVFSPVDGTFIPLDFDLFQVSVWKFLLVKYSFVFLISLASFKTVK